MNPPEMICHQCRNRTECFHIALKNEGCDDFERDSLPTEGGFPWYLQSVAIGIVLGLLIMGGLALLS